MRTPTALLRIGAALGIQNAKNTLDTRRGLKTPILTKISNSNKEWKETCQQRGFRTVASMPPQLMSVRVTPLRTTTDYRPGAGMAQIEKLLCIPPPETDVLRGDEAPPTVVTQRGTLPQASLQKNVLPDNRSWLHPGSSDGTAQNATWQKPTSADVDATLKSVEKRMAPDVPRLPVLARELHPKGLMNQHDFLDPRHDGLAIDLFGEEGAADYGLAAFDIAYTAINSGLFERPEELPIAPASVDAAHPQNPFEEGGAALRPAEAHPEIAAFDAMLSSYSGDEGAVVSNTPPPPPPPMPGTNSSSPWHSKASTPPSSPPSLSSPGHTPSPPPAHADLMADLIADLSRRQALKPVTQAEKPAHSDMKAAFLGIFDEMNSRFELTKARDAYDADASEAASNSGDSGHGSDLSEIDTAVAPRLIIREAATDHVVADHEWGDSTA